MMINVLQQRSMMMATQANQRAVLNGLHCLITSHVSGATSNIITVFDSNVVLHYILRQCHLQNNDICKEIFVMVHCSSIVLYLE